MMTDEKETAVNSNHPHGAADLPGMLICCMLMHYAFFSALCV